MIRRYLKSARPAPADARAVGELKPVPPAAWREGRPVLGPDQVYVMKYGREFHTQWCQAVAEKWASAPRGLLVTLLADVGSRSRCPQCSRAASPARERHTRGRHAPEPAPSASVIPLRVVGIAHGILYLAARPEFRDLLSGTAVEPATPLLVGGRRDGMVVRVDVSRDEPLLVVQMDPRAAFRDGPYQARLRAPLQRSATKPYAVEAIEPAPREPDS
ncbi:hypothetical protein E7Y32_02860 [Arthrobacter sp. UKPF54-2]|uniref:hypothetical protein n=1 Tax=Arthrobacter sp. UKPF54-2 TaxID=2600159 RepID=UPI0011B10DC2|nr:hypothetical protein [Arthrobacter sp. UKPF54-2]QDY89270.1 hypothetical protein E7Y32_02860 [Arthrobacter sp. UKPF54-2]